MNCLQADGLIQEALDGALTSPQRQTLDAHLKTCADCQAAWEEYRGLARTATIWVRRPVHEADPGEAFTAQVMARVAARPPVPERGAVPVWQRLALVGVVLAALFACGLLFPLPGVMMAAPSPDLLPRPQAALSLPGWLWATLGALPSASARLWADLTGGVTVSAALVSLLSAALLLNGLLYARAVRGTRGPLAR